MSTERVARIEHLLAAALPEFARSGPAGARVDAIARAADMNKRLLYHYVGDKEALFDAVLERALECVRADPFGLHTDEWRVICHGVAASRLTIPSDFSELYTGDGRPVMLGLTLLSAVLPEFADRLLGNEAADETGREAALRQAVRAVGASGNRPKPRLKLRPDLRAGRH